MSIAFTPWPEDLARRYRDKGYWIGRPLNEILRKAAKDRPNAIALLCGERRFSYAELDLMSDWLAAALRQRGLGAHDTALVQLPNVAEFYIVFFALLKIGVVPLNALYSHQRYELGHYARAIQPRLLIASADHPLFADRAFIAELRGVSPGLQTVLLLGAAERGLEVEDLGALLTRPVVGAEADGGAPTASHEVAFFQLSGGSTGSPKLIPRTHDDYDYSVRASAEICGLTPATRYLCALPAAHNFPLSSPGALGVFHAGGLVALAPDPEPERCFDLIARHGLTMAGLVPAAARLWVKAAAGRREALRTLDLVQVGGAMLPEELARRIPAELGCRLQQVLGMAEGLVNYTRLDDDDERVFTTQGRPISPDDEIRVVDDSGLPVPVGEVGMLTTRGPYTFRGYYRSPEHNARAFDAEGFYRSGDLVRQRPDGYLQVVGRAKDQINRGGEKIAAEEIERLLMRHEAVGEAALVAMPDPLLGEKSCAFIVPRGPDARHAAGPVALRRHLRGLGLADYKLPDRFETLERLPLTPVGKVDKTALRARIRPLSPNR
ncbi:(2,3-dihydroxybenzoyl)adenylate synthase [Phenylobacterium sp. LjRoot225]|uniref:(2,3-dihydroxybenzoyl)adenylate synthase n=1 Tax=Phenylobacterium sp. LjRoot225 TaxID=3342285 RepID=UPI003ED00246